MHKNYILLLLVVCTACKRSTNGIVPAHVSLVALSFFDAKIKIDSTLISSYNDERLTAFYAHYNNQTAWDNSRYRELLLAEIANAAADGLQPKDYQLASLQSYEGNYANLNDSIRILYDLKLTKNAQLYLYHLSNGKLNPKKIYNDWDVAEKNTDINPILFEALDNGNLTEAIDNCRPKHPMYQKLKNALLLLDKFGDDTKIGLIDLRQRILPNKKSIYIPIIKKRLMYWNDMAVKDTVLSAVYDKNTFDAVKVFQARHGLKADGVIGRGTIEALNFYKSQRREQIVANMERWRWFARDFGKNYLLINIPDYSIVAVKGNDTMQTQRVVVGKDTRKTPILESKISNINLNPNWTVPPTILKEDIYPEAEKDRGTFRKKGLIILNNKNQEISPYSWRKADAGKYKYVQNPGRNNSLGVMKINFPNKYAVYLHDTNHRDYFALHHRSLSSGCVRLEKPLEMAAYIVNDSLKWPIKKMADTTDISHYYKLQKEKEIKLARKNAKLLAKNPKLLIEKKTFPKPELKTIVVKVSEEILIHQLYWTAWENKGILQFREDIYCLDATLFAKLRGN